MATLRFDGKILGADAGSGMGVFSRGVVTKDDRGLACAAGEPRWGDESIIAGGIDPASVAELMPASTYLCKVMRSGIDADGVTPITVTTERATSNAGLSLNIYYGSVRALKAAGPPSVDANGFGVRDVDGVGQWWRWEAARRGMGQGDLSDLGLTGLGGITTGASAVGLPHNVADDFGRAIANMRVDGDSASGGNTPYDSDGAVIFIPRAALVMWGCVKIQCVALRYCSGTVAGGDAQYLPLGTGFFYWQRERDPSRTGGGWVTLRGEDDFLYETGGVKHDHQPGRFRGENWGPGPTTTWRRSNDRPDRFEYGSSDYMFAGDAGAVGPDAAAKIAQNFWGRFRRDPETGLWAHAAALEDLIDMSAHATLGATATGHNHGCRLIECVESAAGRNSEQRIAMRGDPGEVNGLSRRVYRAPDGYDPDDPAFDAHFGDIANWDTEEYVLGEGDRGPGSRQMSGQQGPEFGELMLFSDDNNEDVCVLSALTEGDPVSMRTIFGPSQDAYAYTFRVNCDKPATPNCRMVCDRFNAEAGPDDTASVIYSPDGGATWATVHKVSIPSMTVALCGDDIILGSLNGGMYAVPVPGVHRATPIALAPGGRNCAIAAPFVTAFGSGASATALTRNVDGRFVDGSHVLPADPSLASRAVKLTSTTAGTLVVHPGDATSVAGTGGGFTDGPAMRTVVWDVLANPHEFPASPYLAANRRMRILNNFGGASSFYCNRALGQARVAVTDGSRWARDGWVFGHHYGSGDKSTVTVRALLEDAGGLTQRQRHYAICEGVYEGDQHVPFPVTPDTDASGAPETVAFGAPVRVGSTMFGAFRLGPTVSGSIAWYEWNGSAFVGIRVPITFAQAGNSDDDNYFVAEIMLGVPSGNVPTTRTLRLRGKAGGNAFDEEVAIGLQSLASSGEYLMLYPGCPVVFAFQITEAGIVPVVYVDGYKVTDDQPVANTDGFDAEMIWTQVGAGFEDADARAAELRWFGARVTDAPMDAGRMNAMLQGLAFLESTAQGGGARRSRGRSRARATPAGEYAAR